MSMTTRPPIPSFIPESAPFSPEQRTWLNGLFAGLFGLEGSITPLSAAEAAKLIPGLIDGGVAPAPAEADDSAPWHDPAMPLPERMKLADGKPLPRRLMAAMGQQDCGQCGYNCKDYADALFVKSEKRLNLCVPGGKETARMLRELYQELDGAAAVPATTAPPLEAKPTPSARPGRSRDNPVYATFLSRRRLNMPGSEKETWHRSRLRRRRLPRHLPRQRSRFGRGGARGAQCAGGLSHRRPYAARRTHRRRCAVAGARHAVPAHLLSHRRRAQAEGEAACRR
jgi:sulfite reductase (NADPH) flavoprotein alpha-component